MISALSFDQSFSLVASDVNYELLDGQAIAKMSPKFFHARIQKTLLFLLDTTLGDQGRVEPKWAIILECDGKDWIPVPDLTYISYQRLAPSWCEDAACPTAPDLVIEIISPGQKFNDLASKAADYLRAGVSRVWVIDTQAQSITVFYPDGEMKTFLRKMLLEDVAFPNLSLIPENIFQKISEDSLFKK